MVVLVLILYLRLFFWREMSELNVQSPKRNNNHNISIVSDGTLCSRIWCLSTRNIIQNSCNTRARYWYIRGRNQHWKSQYSFEIDLDTGRVVLYETVRYFVSSVWENTTSLVSRENRKWKVVNNVCWNPVENWDDFVSAAFLLLAALANTVKCVRKHLEAHEANIMIQFSSLLCSIFPFVRHLQGIYIVRWKLRRKESESIVCDG